jgi:hypothetical protein
MEESLYVFMFILFIFFILILNSDDDKKIILSTNIGSGTFYGNQTLKIISDVENTKIYYTLNRETPNRNSDIYTEPLILTGNTTLKAVGYKKNYIDSNIITRTYVFNTVVSAPAFHPYEFRGFTTNNPIQVTISSSTPNAIIRYIIIHEGEDELQIPNNSSTIYTSPIDSVETSFMVKAFAMREGMNSSEIRSINYSLIGDA